MKRIDFEGHWQLDRIIDDALTGTQSRVRGTATIAGGHYDESTVLTLPDGTSLNGTRRYLWDDCDMGIKVRFADGRGFHTIRFDAPTDMHWCDPDTYDVTYDFSQFPDWTSCWTVKGPRKDYRMVTRYRKQG